MKPSRISADGTSNPVPFVILLHGQRGFLRSLAPGQNLDRALRWIDLDPATCKPSASTSPQPPLRTPTDVTERGEFVALQQNVPFVGDECGTLYAALNFPNGLF